MEWFKFYGQDWLTDTKITRLDAIDRVCYLTLLCLASSSDEPGKITNCTEDDLIRLTQLSDSEYDGDSEAQRAKGILQRLSDNKMITIETEGVIIVKNFVKRQTKTLSGYERLRLYRERRKEQNKANQKTNRKKVNDNKKITNDNGMITVEKSRVEKRRLENTNTLETALAVSPQKPYKKEDLPADPHARMAVLQEIIERKDKETFIGIEMFSAVNLNYESFFENKNQRGAVARIIKKHGLKKLADLVKLASFCNSRQFCPAKATIHTPIEMERNMADMIDFYKREYKKDEPPRVLDLTK